MTTIKIYRIGIIICLSLLIASGSVLGQSSTTRSKQVKKSYNLTKKTRLAIDNKYGDVHINTWDQNRMEVTVTIKAEKRSEDRAQQLLEQVEIEINGNESSGTIEFETHIRGNINNGRNEKLTIDYDVNMPKTSPVDLRNKYGNIYLADLDAESEINASYGNIRIENLSAMARIDLAYGGGEIEGLGNAILDISYSNLFLNQGGNLEIDSRYSNLDMGNIGDLEISNKYGNLKLKAIRSIVGDSKYGKIEIREISHILDLEISYGGGLTVDKISKNFSRVIIESEYVTSNLTFEQGASAQVEAHASYGSIKYDRNQFDFNYINTSNNSGDFKGKMGTQGSPKSEVRIDTRYGSVNLNIR